MGESGKMVRVIVQALGQFGRGTLIFIRFMAPFILQAAVVVFAAMVLTATSLIRGVGPTTHDIASDIEERAARADVPEHMLPYVYWTTRAMTVVAIAFGWLGLVYFTVLVIVVLLY